MEEMSERPICHVVAGPNGSGKSTFALRYLPEYAGDWVRPALAEPMRKELGI
jgi:ABC-type Mn2+/Zn2+ transport system ATPase subunit